MRYSILIPLLVAVVLVTGCGVDDDQVVPPSGRSADPLLAEKRRALSTALDTLEALVVTLEQIEDPVTAWNRAKDVSRLLSELERTRADYAMGPNKDEAARRFPAEVDRLKRLEARRDMELDRIMANRVTAQVLIEEMAEESARREAAAGN